MANLIRLTVTNNNKLTNTGPYVFNTLWIKRVKQNGTGSLFYYVDGDAKESGALKVFVSEPASTINAALSGPLDMQISVNVLSKDREIFVAAEQEHIKTSDIIFGYYEVKDPTTCFLVIAETPLKKVKYKCNNTLDSIITAANTYNISGGGGTWGSITGDITNQTDLQSEFAMTNTTFSNSILLDKVVGRNYGTNDITSNITISLDSTNIKDGGNAQVGLRGDGTHTPVLTAFNKYDTNGSDYDPTLNMINVFAFFRWLGKVYWNIVDQYASSGPITLSAPGSFTATANGQNEIDLTWTAIQNASSYKLEWSANGTSGWTQIGGTLSQATTSYNHTNLTASTQYFYRISSIGDGVSYLTSGFSTGNATTSSANQLSTPTLNTPTVISTTELDLSWSTVSNVTSWKLEWSTNGSTGWTQIGGTIAAGTLSYQHTSLTANTAYYYRLTAVGNGTTYTDSNPSAVVNNTTKNVAPTLVSSVTSTDGLTITHTFSRAMAASPTTTGYSTSPSKTISSATRNADTTKIDVVVSVAFASGDTITATIPQWSPADGGDNFAGVSGTSVTNNVVSAYIAWDLFSNMHFATDRLINDAANISGATSSQTLDDGKAIYMQGYVPIPNYTTLGLYTAHSIRQYNQMSCSMSTNNGYLAYYDSGATLQTTSYTMNATYGGSPSHLALARIRRSGNQYILEYSFDSGAWVNVYTWTNNNSLYVVASMAYSQDKYILEPKIY